ncbi:MAG: hypothetical protein CM1200mP29_09220 [Verrucomicrobiota bacterium]|nr:MAG: hypothetical protein CM1200mP29_09220 [Verrucomicrobiota bacterium]
MPRVRSVAMNGYIEGGLYDPTMSSTVPSIHGLGWRKYDILSHIIDPSPSDLWIFADEHPDSINNGGFVLYPYKPVSGETSRPTTTTPPAATPTPTAMPKSRNGPTQLPKMSRY